MTMARAHEVVIGADGRAFEQAIKNDVIKPIDEAARALDDLADDTSDAGSDGARDIGKLESALKDVESASGKTGRSIGRDMDDGFDKAKRGANDFKDEANSSAREAAASFDGSAESIGETFQEVAANALAGFGPLGAAAGLAMAAGLGVGMQQLEKFNEAVETSRETAFSVAADMDAATKRIDFQSSLANWTKDMDKYAQAQDIARVTGRDLLEVLDALASGGTKLDDLTGAFEQNALYSDVTLGRVTELTGVLQGTAQGFAQGTAAAEANALAMGRYADEVGVATGKTDDLGNKIVRLPDGKEVVINAETGQAYEDIDALEKRQVADKHATVRYGVDDSDVRGYRPPTVVGYVEYKPTGPAARFWQ